MDPGQELQHLTCTKTPTLPCNAKEKKIYDSSGHMVQVHHSPVDLCKSRFVISKWVHGSPLLLVGLLDLLTDSDFIDQWFSESCAYCWSSCLHTVPFSRLPWLIYQKEKKRGKSSLSFQFVLVLLLLLVLVPPHNTCYEISFALPTQKRRFLFTLMKFTIE